MSRSSLLPQVEQFAAEHALFAELGGATLVVAVSGGPDSLALLHVLTRMAPRMGFALHVAHMEHGIRGEESRADAEFVAGLAASWGLACTVGSFDVPAYADKHGLSLEAAARRVRYRFLGHVAQAVAPIRRRFVATGHNADDQVETTLLRFVRGSGLRGLAGMRPLTGLPVDKQATDLPWPIASAKLIRPLLATWRSDIESYCAANDLKPRFDSTNLDIHYTRNRIRQQFVPLLEDMKPGFKRRAWHMAAVFDQEDACLERMLDVFWTEQDTKSPQHLPLNNLAPLPQALQRRALLRAAANLPTACGPLTEKLTALHIRAALRLLDPATRVGARTQWPCDVLVSKQANALVFSGPGLAEQDKAAGGFLLPVGVALLQAPAWGELNLGGWRLRIRQREKTAGTSPTMRSQFEQIELFDATMPEQTALFDADVLEKLAQGRPLVLRTRLPGERIQPFGFGGKHRKLQDVFVDAHVPVEQRERYAVLSLPDVDGVRGEAIWIPGLRRSELAPVTAYTRRVLLLEAVLASDI